MPSLRATLFTLCLTTSFAMSGCKAWNGIVAGPPDHLAPGTAASASTPWTPATADLPPVAPVTQAAFPEGYQPGMAISLPQILDTALENNPQTRIAWLQARAAEADLGSSSASYLPTVDLNAQLTRQQSPSSGSTSRQTTIGPSLALSYLLFDFGGRAATVAIAKDSLIAANLRHNSVLQNVALRVQQDYYDTLDAKALVDAQEATVKELQANVDAANARHDAGLATIADVLQARTALSQAQLRLDSLRGTLRTLEGSLATTMGLPVATRFELGTLPSDVGVEATSSAIEDLLKQAEASRPDLASARATAQGAKERIRQVRSAGLPTIGLAANAARNRYDGANGAFNATTYTAGLNLHFPLFTGFRNTWDIRAAQFDAQAADEQVRSLGQQVDLEVWASYYALQTAAQRVATSRELLSTAQQSLNVASGRYHEGLSSILDLLTAQAALENARAQEVQARADWLQSVAQLSHDLGTLNLTNAAPAAGVTR